VLVAHQQTSDPLAIAGFFVLERRGFHITFVATVIVKAIKQRLYYKKIKNINYPCYKPVTTKWRTSRYVYDVIESRDIINDATN